MIREMGGMGAWMILWGLLGLALLILIVLSIVWLARMLFEPRRPTTEDRAELELRHRYAAGELTRDEYQQRLTDLRQP